MVEIDGEAVIRTAAFGAGNIPLTDAQLRFSPIDIKPAFSASGKTAVTGEFTNAGQTSPAFTPIAGRGFNITISGATVSASIRLERSFGSNAWHPITANGVAIMVFSTPISEQWSDDETGVQYRLACTSYTTGPVTYRISQ